MPCCAASTGRRSSLCPDPSYQIHNTTNGACGVVNLVIFFSCHAPEFPPAARPRQARPHRPASAHRRPAGVAAPCPPRCAWAAHAAGGAHHWHAADVTHQQQIAGVNRRAINCDSSAGTFDRARRKVMAIHDRGLTGQDHQPIPARRAGRGGPRSWRKSEISVESPATKWGCLRRRVIFHPVMCCPRAPDWEAAS